MGKWISKFSILALIVGFGSAGCSNETSTNSNSQRNIERISLDCGTTKAQTDVWFATHKTGWAEHVEQGVKCMREHQ